MENLSLGKTVEYKEHYAPELLQGVKRSLSRDNINLPKTLPFDGIDIWNGYELSWLNLKGKPQIAIMRCYVPIQSPFLIESKSFKLYLNSFNQTRLSSIDEVKKRLSNDLSQCAGDPVRVELIPFDKFSNIQMGTLDGTLLDTLDISMEDYEISPSILRASESPQSTSHIKEQDVSETLVSHLLKSNCLITNQPDWGSVLVKYIGPQIDHTALLKYLISFRQHNEFHEQCVERIFSDILHHCQPKSLTVYARYTRRGGLDINPFRSNFEAPYADIRLARQ
ncbi:NADPH-dependent 7-cyano-7-deazaguanine reductase QueF [Ningiella sp. W23]|uniref:NADPH-dependent 7-cyano-7-deazaguanine reductase QueF n=1 Tax=Ningiella sp. W23 TaxID=3023715 RepID=UPI003756BBAC